jgi:hypothetical protein
MSSCHMTSVPLTIFLHFLLLKISLYSGSTLRKSFAFVSEISAEGTDKTWRHLFKKIEIKEREKL